jgi:hypothetical protein
VFTHLHVFLDFFFLLFVVHFFHTPYFLHNELSGRKRVRFSCKRSRELEETRWKWRLLFYYGYTVSFRTLSSLQLLYPHRLSLIKYSRITAYRSGIPRIRDMLSSLCWLAGNSCLKLENLGKTLNRQL